MNNPDQLTNHLLADLVVEGTTGEKIGDKVWEEPYMELTAKGTYDSEQDQFTNINRALKVIYFKDYNLLLQVGDIITVSWFRYSSNIYIEKV